MLTDDARYQNVPPLLDLTRILKSYTIKEMIGENSWKNRSDKSHSLTGQNGKTLLSKLTWKISQLTQSEQASR